MSRDESFDSIQLQFGNLEEDWPTLKANQAKQLSLENADFKLATNKTIIFGGNGKISAVGDLSFLTGATSPTEQMKIFANGNIGIGTGATVPTNKLEVAGTIKATDLEVTGSFKLGEITVNKFSSDGTFNGNSDLSVPTEKAVKTYVDDKLKGGISQWSDGTDGNISYSKGNVGIGTKTRNPQANLDVAGNLQILTDSNPIRFTSVWSRFPDSKPNQAEISNDTGDYKALIIVGNKSAGGVRRVSLWDDVGIGTSKPEAKLHIAGNLMLGKGIAVDEFVSDLGSVQGDGETSVPTVSALRKAVNDLKEELSKQFQKQIQSLQQQNQLLQQQNQSLTTDLQNTKNELNQLKNQVNRVRPASVIAINDNNEWIALKAGGYNVGDLESIGIGNDRLANLLLPPNWKVFCYKDANFQSNPIITAGPFPEWGFVPGWLKNQVSSIKIQTT